VGLGNFDASWMTGSGVPWDLRYQYLAGGVNTGNGWSTWNDPPGQFALYYIQASRSADLIPVFIHYQILQSAPHYAEFQNLQNASTMRAYYDDFKLLMEKCTEAGGRVFVNIEPDLTGFLMQHPSNTGDDASLQPASVASSGHPDLAGYPNTVRGFYQALAHLRDRYAPQVSLGLDVSTWGASHDIGIERDPSYDWQGHANRTANYLNSLGPGFQLLFFSPLDRDAAYYQFVRGEDRWWDDNSITLPHFNRISEWMGRIIDSTQKRALMWQVPNGNRVYRTQNNTPGHWQDNRPEYFFNPTNGRAHIAQWANYGFVGIMFGAGQGDQTHYSDNQGDGITNPPPINGNNQLSAHPDDDGGYIRVQSAAYYAGGTVPLPGGPPQPTPFPTPTAGGCNITFSDVRPIDYFYEPVRYLYCAGAIGGYPDNTFRPNNTATRGQLAKIVVLAEGMPINTAGGPHFSDVSPANSFYPYVETAYNAGIVSGYGDGTFRPNNPVTRGQLCKIVVQAAGWPVNTTGGPHFPDVPTTHTFYPFIETVYNHSIISGYPDGRFRPESHTTRAHISKVVHGAVTGP
jgi:hypothetical protein